MDYPSAFYGRRRPTFGVPLTMLGPKAVRGAAGRAIRDQCDHTRTSSSSDEQIDKQLKPSPQSPAQRVGESSTGQKVLVISSDEYYSYEDSDEDPKKSEEKKGDSDEDSEPSPSLIPSSDSSSKPHYNLTSVESDDKTSEKGIADEAGDTDETQTVTDVSDSVARPKGNVSESPTKDSPGEAATTPPSTNEAGDVKSPIDPKDMCLKPKSGPPAGPPAGHLQRSASPAWPRAASQWRTTSRRALTPGARSESVLPQSLHHRMRSLDKVRCGKGRTRTRSPILRRRRCHRPRSRGRRHR